MTMTLREAQQLEDRVGLPLEWIEVTQFGDKERYVVLGTPLCDYCGTPDPTGKCTGCGRSVLRDGPLPARPNRSRIPERRPDWVRR